ncbi:MAG: Uncharacterized protein XD42_0693 [Thermodesulfobacterium sp. 37_54]|jgi:hypothetical protein|uniref:Fe-S oxidoreductase n=1 Tax=Thermodesulfobacterium commune TaxID=1741 RepID=A0A101FIQ2_9BACT|nr:MAG: Uncharacterized protein XD42_0693 [Thermodesulfobacterium sp. 37_54]KUK19536.1 MAG: Uncharacterized protein XD55_0417 [Thermodesulfobacterium commune]KUK37739.1 MAG: Uncharacterized protein XD67_0981 [Thermodesulfobacterium commune]HAA84122.1 Fe-S oxidoreductase [Thermodesulfobacterium commune]HBT04048.1 Fe-S oxidoreductase [Thermodesulfobacterium commune]
MLKLEGFTCQRCGACCQGESTVSLTQEEILRIAQFLNLSEEVFREKYTVKVGKHRVEMKTKDGYCIFFDKKEKLCRIHPVKPKKCKEWPLIEALSKDPSTLETLKNYCMGIKILQI